MRVGQAWSCLQLYLQSLGQSSGHICESRIQEWIQPAVATKQVADASSSSPKGRRQTDLVSSLWVSSALSAQVLACRVRLEELEWKKFIPVSGKGKKNICSHHQRGNLSQ